MHILLFASAAVEAHEIRIEVGDSEVRLEQTLTLNEDGKSAGRLFVEMRRVEDRGVRYVVDRVTRPDGLQAYTVQVFGLWDEEEAWLGNPTVLMFPEEPGLFTMPLVVGEWKGGLRITFTPSVPSSGELLPAPG